MPPKRRGKKKGKKLSKAAKKAAKAAKKLKKQLIREQQELNLLQEKELRDSAATGDVDRTVEALAKFKEFDDPPGIVDNPDSFGMSAMLHAAMRGHKRIVEILIAGHKGYEEVEKFDEETGDLVINEATGDPETIRVPKLWANSDVNFQSTGGGSTALMWACERGHTECTKLLLQAGCVPDVRNDYGWTALMLAALNGHVDCVQELFAHEGAVRAVMEETIDFMHVNSGNSAFMWATTKGQLRVMQTLLVLKADCRGVNGLGMTAVEVAETAGHVDAVQLLKDWDITCERQRAKALDDIEMYGMDYIRKQGIDIESLTECWHACPPQVAIPIVLVDEETQEELPVLNEETGEPTFRIEGGCTCLKLVLPEEEKKEDDVEEKVADVQMQKGKGARSKKQNKKDSKRDRGRSRTDRGGKKKSNSPSPSSRRRKRK
jgi:ankyrin repeat protein